VMKLGLLVVAAHAAAGFSPQARLAAERAWHAPSKALPPKSVQAGALPQTLGALAGSALVAGAACFASAPVTSQISHPWAEETVGTFAFAVAFVSAYLAFSVPKESTTASDADWACLVPDDFEEVTDALCGALSFDSSDDGPMCIEITDGNGELRWACSH